jgi:hypothetical protein
VTHLRDQLGRLFDTEPEAPYDIDDIVRSGRRARRRRNVAVTAAGTLGAAGVTAAVVLPAVTGGANGDSVVVGSRPAPTSSPSPTAATGNCYILAGSPKGAQRRVGQLIRSGRVGAHPSITRVKSGHDHRTLLEVCAHGVSPKDPQQAEAQDSQPPAGPPYDYTEQPSAVSSRLGAHLQERANGFGLSVTFTRPFSQETSNLDAGHPSSFGGNVDVHEAGGYADIGVQVTHEVTELVPFTGDCTAAQQCAETTLPDGSVLRTGQVQAGRNDVILTAEVHRPDGVVVHAQESNYPFGPDAGSQPHGDQPLTLHQLVALAEDDGFTF